MSESHKKNPSRYWLGKKRLSPSEETLSKMSETQIRIGNKPPVQYGEKNNRWRGGITPINNKIRGSIEYTLWENGVFARDGYTCQKCHQTLKPYKLVGHHILNFSSHPELRFAIDNGITFCKKDHKKFHLKYGFKNNTKEQAEEFIN